MTDIPEPENTGSAGTQVTEPEKQLSPAAPDTALEKLPLEKTIEGLSATRSRSMGGEIAAGLLSGSFNQICHELKETKHELRETRSDLKTTNQDLSDCKERAAVLSERVRSGSRSRHLQNISILAGTTFVALGIELYRNDLDKFAYIVGGLGALMILLGWFFLPGGDKK